MNVDFILALESGPHFRCQLRLDILILSEEVLLLLEQLESACFKYCGYWDLRIGMLYLQQCQQVL